MSEYLLTDHMRQWAKANGFDAELHIDYFQDYLANRVGKPYKNLDAAFRNCVRCDWGRIRFQVEMKTQKRKESIHEIRAKTIAGLTGQSGTFQGEVDY